MKSSRISYIIWDPRTPVAPVSIIFIIVFVLKTNVVLKKLKALFKTTNGEDFEN
jgi:hypothetical protein